MLERFKKTWAFFWKFIKSKKKWVKPCEADILLYDSVGQQYINKYLNNWTTQVLHTRNEVINVYVLLSCIWKKGSLKQLYIDCYIEHVKPSLVITFIDNNINFLSVSSRHPSIKTLFIQNGWRGYYADIFESLDLLNNDDRNNFHVDYMMTFGSIMGDKFSCYISGSVLPIGSIKNNYFSVKKHDPNNILAFISQWHDKGFYMSEKFYSHDEFFRYPDEFILGVMEDYALKNNKRLVIIPRFTDENEMRLQEEEYYNSILKNKVHFLCPEGDYSSYQAIDKAEVVVSIDSTLGYEAIARGAKTAIFSIRGEMLHLPGFSYGWPGKFDNVGTFWTNKPNPDILKRILDNLFEINLSQWKDELKKIQYSRLMLHDPYNKLFENSITHIIN